MRTMRVVIIDHFDSFTFNIFHSLAEIGIHDIKVIRTDRTLNEIEIFRPTHVVLSAGPGHPSEAELFCKTLDHFGDDLPVLGICLGHQAIAFNAGAEVVPNTDIMHGKTSSIKHNGDALFEGIPETITVMRYHSLIVPKNQCTASGLNPIAWTENDEVMALRNMRYPNVVGVQFHPESIFTPEGKRIFSNFCSF